MSEWTEWLGQPVWRRLGWALAHFLWQGALLAVAYAGLRRGLAQRSAQARYLAGCLVLGLMAAAPVITFLVP